MRFARAAKRSTERTTFGKPRFANALLVAESAFHDVRRPGML
jgi:hypothetical protein